MDPTNLIFFKKMMGMGMGVLLIIIGYLLIIKGIKDKFEFSGTFANKITAKLKSGTPGLLVILLGAIIILIALLPTDSFKKTTKTTKKEITQAEKIEIPTAEEIYNTKSNSGIKEE
jgi:hypothetical protein